MRIRSSCWRPSVAFAVLALLSLVAAACGDDDDSEPAGSTVESEAPTTSADDGEAEAPADSDDGEAEAPADSDDGEAEAPADSDDGEVEAPADSGDGDAGASTPAEVVELTVLTGFTGGDRAAYEQIVNRFNMAHDDIKVTMDIQPWDSIAQTLPAAWGTGGGPDIATPNFDPGIVFRYVDDGLALPLDDLIGTGDGQLDPAVVPQFVIDAFTIDGSLYAAPGNVATLQLYYNKDLLDAGRTLSAARDRGGLRGLREPADRRWDFRRLARRSRHDPDVAAADLDERRRCHGVGHVQRARRPGHNRRARVVDRPRRERGCVADRADRRRVRYVVRGREGGAADEWSLGRTGVPRRGHQSGGRAYPGRARRAGHAGLDGCR